MGQQWRVMCWVVGGAAPAAVAESVGWADTFAGGVDGRIIGGWAGWVGVGSHGTKAKRRLGAQTTQTQLPTELSCTLSTSAHLTSPHLTSPHLTSPHLTSPHLPG